jgi:hypothetical protein
MYKLIIFKKINHLKQISYSEFSKSHEAFMWTFNIFQGFCRCTCTQCKNTTNVFTGVAIRQML